MPGSVEHIRAVRPDVDSFIVANAVVNLDRTWRSYANPPCLHVEHFQQGIVILVKQDGGAGSRSQLHGAAHMIDVGMGNHDLLYLQLVFSDKRQHVLNVIDRKSTRLNSSHANISYAVF